jgi:hypothetical protein
MGRNKARDYQPAELHGSGAPGAPGGPGYKFQEATQFIEFCVELDSQDDRITSPENPNYLPQIDHNLWNPMPDYDSRQALARDPRYNGFGPYQSAWVLYMGRNENAGAYAIAPYFLPGPA